MHTAKQRKAMQDKRHERKKESELTLDEGKSMLYHLQKNARMDGICLPANIHTKTLSLLLHTLSLAIHSNPRSPHANSPQQQR